MAEIVSLNSLTEEPHAEVFDGDPRTVRLELSAGESIPAHTHPRTDIVLHLLDGQLELTLGEERHELDAGDIAQFSGDREISPRALDDATALLVFAPSQD